MVALGTKGVGVSVGIGVSVGSIVGVAVGITTVAEGVGGASIVAGAQLVRPKTRVISSSGATEFRGENLAVLILASL